MTLESKPYERKHRRPISESRLRSNFAYLRQNEDIRANHVGLQTSGAVAPSAEHRGERRQRAPLDAATVPARAAAKALASRVLLSRRPWTAHPASPGSIARQNGAPHAAARVPVRVTLVPKAGAPQAMG
eukprot:CAMPEP_0179160480 /NCGR_PEP_ID=MMETSP0796-20121207/78465_1 /TAXON_ID=73915 /ORGANISM="Pyrodinium bahamense, Strain pbaha01" /LENGTH=128 /DNA_ID=CAMNT_0020862419 /DNA_START=471 /DNA_END=853 /DNA_ORIENTATION=+